MNGACACRSSVVGSEPCASAHDHDIHAAWHEWCPRCHIRFHANKRVDMVWIWKSRATHHQVPPFWVRVQKRMRKCSCRWDREVGCICWNLEHVDVVTLWLWLGFSDWGSTFWKVFVWDVVCMWQRGGNVVDRNMFVMSSVWAGASSRRIFRLSLGLLD